MFQSEHDIYVYESDEKPNKYASIVLYFCVAIVLLTWILDEVGIFRVGKTEMRVGSAITLIVTLIPLSMLTFNKKAYSNPTTKYFVVAAASMFTFAVGTFMTFHTTIMLLFPIFMAMLYRSSALGVFAAVTSIASTVITPILGYLLGTWDIELFKELILIGTNGTAVIQDAHAGLSLLNVGKIILYLSFPRLLMVGSCSMLLFYIIRLSAAHVQNQIELFKLSHVDALTGLYNRNYFNEVTRSPTSEERVAVLFFDVNNLKLANDTNGHEYGDLLLKRSAKSLLAICDGENSYGFRIGGDEFVVISRLEKDEDVNSIIKKWRKALDEINVENASDYGGLKCSVACGYTIGRLSEIEELVQLSDEEMYKNKQAMKAS